MLRTRQPHLMAVQRYDLQRPDGTWEERYWAPVNVLNMVVVPALFLRYGAEARARPSSNVEDAEATGALEPAV